MFAVLGKFINYMMPIKLKNLGSQMFTPIIQVDLRGSYELDSILDETGGTLDANVRAHDANVRVLDANFRVFDANFRVLDANVLVFYCHVAHCLF